MISSLGLALVLLGLLFATVGSVVAFRAGQTRSPLLRMRAEQLGLSFAASLIAANLLMVYALVTHDFSVSYVAEVGSRSTPVLFTIVSLWSSLSGSILFWGGILGVYVAGVILAHRGQHREFMPYTLGFLLACSVFFAWLVAGVANPFAPTPLPIPLDGPGPNPLLQNHILMAIHPPTLYLGYVGMVVPFSMAAAALLAGRLEAGFIVPLRRWLLVPWTFLTVGIVLGGWWSYEVLGWGGYWAWDPVENASFHPWLTATAAVHSLMLVQRRGMGRTWTIVLIFASFLLTLLGTFMTRSGVFNSVHSFTQSDIGPIFLAFIAVVFAVCTVLLAFRGHVLDGDAEDDKPAGNTAVNLFGLFQIDGLHPLGREFAIVIQNWLFSLFTFVVLMGTLYPLIMEAGFGKRLSVGEPYFDGLALPIGAAIVFLMGVGPAVPWGRARSVNRLLAPLVGGIVLAGAFAAGGFAKPGTILAMFVSGFALVANGREMVEPALARARSKGEALPTAAAQVWTRTRRRFGGHVAHLGVVMMVVAIALSKGYKVEKDLMFEPGVTQTVGGYSATFTGARLDKEPHRDSLVASFTVHKEGAPLGVAEPRLNFYRTQREPIGTPAVMSSVRGDVYLSLMQVADDGSYATARLMIMPGVPWIWLATLIIMIGSVLAAWPVRSASLGPAAEPVSPGAVKA